MGPAAFGRRREAEHTVSERDTKRIIRQWDREIEDEARREEAREGGEQPWQMVAWGALWLLWLTLLAALIVHAKALR